MNLTLVKAPKSTDYARSYNKLDEFYCLRHHQGSTYLNYFLYLPTDVNRRSNVSYCYTHNLDKLILGGLTVKGRFIEDLEGSFVEDFLRSLKNENKP